MPSPLTKMTLRALCPCPSLLSPATALLGRRTTTPPTSVTVVQRGSPRRGLPDVVVSMDLLLGRGWLCPLVGAWDVPERRVAASRGTETWPVAGQCRPLPAEWAIASPMAGWL